MADLSIQQTAQALGISIDTLRFYERVGLLPRVPRLENGHRRYRQDTLAWLRFALRLRDTGMPLETIRRYGELALQGENTVPERRALLETHLENVDRQMQQLEEARRLIRKKLELYDNTDAQSLPKPPSPRRNA